MNYNNTFTLRWSDLDPNVHMRHSAYYDYAAQTRMNFLAAHGFSLKEMAASGFFPILFREEARFMKEIKYDEVFRIEIVMHNASPDFRKWCIYNHFIKENGEKAALVIVEGAWMDANSRKVASPGEILKHAFEKIPKAEDFEWI